MLNKHGVDCTTFNIGFRWGGSENSLTEVGIQVPKICKSCSYFDPEYMDLGWKDPVPACVLGVWFPVKKGTCKLYKSDIK